MNKIKQGTSRKGDTALLQELLNHAGYDIVVDGDFGPGTDEIVRDFQRKNGLVSDGVVGPKTWMTFASRYPDYYRRLAGKFLSESDLEKAAADLGVEIATVKSVRQVEAGGAGFWGERPKILFERHWFWKKLVEYGQDPGEFSAGNEDILARRPGGYVGGPREYDRLARAKAIHENSALESASWGLFQIMGFHWKSLGYSSVRNFVERMHESEGEQLHAFVRFVKANKLARFLQKTDWAGFAYRYNGPAYKKNRYDEKLEQAYEEAKNGD